MFHINRGFGGRLPSSASVTPGTDHARLEYTVETIPTERFIIDVTAEPVVFDRTATRIAGCDQTSIMTSHDTPPPVWR